nr:hypothetical protein [Tanacetum cinerariifolium]
MSSSTVTYTSISSDSDLPPWGFHLISDVEPQSPEAAPHSPEQAPPSPDYVSEEDPADYPADGGDDDEEESSEDDDDEKEEASEEDEDDEEEHLAPAEGLMEP